jgi:cytochrome c553
MKPGKLFAGLAFWQATILSANPLCQGEYPVVALWIFPCAMGVFPFEQLSDDDLRDISAYYASLPGPDGSKTPDTAPQETELGAKIAAGIHCTNCHGDHFEGVDNIARLAGQREDYVYEALRDFKGGARMATGAAGMAEIVYPLGDEEMKALAHYVSGLH